MGVFACRDVGRRVKSPFSIDSENEEQPAHRKGAKHLARTFIYASKLRLTSRQHLSMFDLQVWLGENLSRLDS